jgi:molybdate transport system ATP-binding protein
VNGFEIDVRVAGRVEASFVAPAGITVVSGRSGAGKSSLLLAILGALRPDTGRIVAAGKTVFDSANAVDAPVRTRGIGMVFQHGALFPHMTVLENVAFATSGTDEARRLLDEVGAGNGHDRRPDQLSGGERQRVSLARALAARPRALLLDEPFSALDRDARSRLAGLLCRLQRDTGVPFLHVTHDLAEALHLGDHLIQLDGGRVLRQGSPAEILAGEGREGTENLFRADLVRHDAEAGYSEIDLDGTRLFCGLLERPVGSRVVFSLHGWEPLIAVAQPGPTSARNVVEGTVATIDRMGPGLSVVVETPHPIAVTVTHAAAAELELTPGKRVFLLIKANALRCLT